MSEAINPAARETLFTGARTHNGWQNLPVSDETLREIYDLMNCSRTAMPEAGLPPARRSPKRRHFATAQCRLLT